MVYVKVNQPSSSPTTVSVDNFPADPQPLTDDTYISGGDMSADITGTGIDVSSYQHACVQAVWTDTGTPTGTLQLQGSNNLSAHYNTVATADVSGVADNALFDVAGFGFRYMRLVYVASSGGTGATLNATVTAKL